MRKRTTTTQSGSVPGTGTSSKKTTVRPDQGFSRKQLQRLVGVSNSTVISAALSHLEIQPSGTGYTRTSAYNNGGRSMGSHLVEYFDETHVAQIRAELQQNSIAVDGRWWNYRGTRFRWDANVSEDPSSPPDH